MNSILSIIAVIVIGITLTEIVHALMHDED